MTTTKLTVSLLAIFTLLIPIECLAQATQHPVAVWCGGDDGLTSRLRDATERAFNATSDLPLATKERPAVYKVLIPTNVEWKQVGARTKVIYSIKLLTMDDREVGTFKGDCWESRINSCGIQIVDRARGLLNQSK